MSLPTNVQPVGGVTPATGITGGPAPCGCPNVIADEVRFPSDQLPGYTPVGPAPVPGAYASVYDPLRPLQEVKGAYVQLHPRQNGHNAYVPPPQPQGETLAQKVTSAVTNAVTNVGDRLGLRRGAAVQLGPISVPTTLAEVQQPFRKLATQLGLAQDQSTPGAAVQFGPISVPTSLEEVQQPFRNLAGRLGLSQSAPGAGVQLGPLSIPTTREEWKQSFEGMQRQIGLRGGTAAVGSQVMHGGQMSYRGDPRFLERLRARWEEYRPRWGGALGAQVGRPMTTTSWVLLALIIAVAIAAFVNRVTLTRKLKELRRNITDRT